MVVVRSGLGLVVGQSASSSPPSQSRVPSHSRLLTVRPDPGALAAAHLSTQRPSGQVSCRGEQVEEGHPASSLEEAGGGGQEHHLPSPQSLLPSHLAPGGRQVSSPTHGHSSSSQAGPPPLEQSSSSSSPPGPVSVRGQSATPSHTRSDWTQVTPSSHSRLEGGQPGQQEGWRRDHLEAGSLLPRPRPPARWGGEDSPPPRHTWGREAGVGAPPLDLADPVATGRADYLGVCPATGGLGGGSEAQGGVRQRGAGRGREKEVRKEEGREVDGRKG